MKPIFTLLIFALAFSACAPPAQSPDAPVDSGQPGAGLAPSYAPRAGDELLLRGEVFLDSTDLLSMESFPVQYSVLLKGNLPTPCHELRVVYHEPNSENKINLDVYSLAEPAAICVMMVQPFQQNIYLGSFSAGHYTVSVNGKQVAEFDT